jgi:hypothetical protein
MNQAFLSGLRILAVDPASRGLGYVVLEGKDKLIEWGFRNARGNKDAQRIAYVEMLLSRYKPDVLILEEFGGRQRSPRIQKITDAFAKVASDWGTQIHRIPRKTVRATFSLRNKYDIAGVLADHFPELKPLCPPRRKIWKSEDPRINIFDALALAWASFAVWTP